MGRKGFRAWLVVFLVKSASITAVDLNQRKNWVPGSFCVPPIGAAERKGCGSRDYLSRFEINAGSFLIWIVQ